MALIGLCRIHRREGRLDEALDLATEALEALEGYEYAFSIGEAHLTLGWTRQIRGETEQAREEFEEARRLGPENGVPHFAVLGRCGLALVGDGDVGEARDALQAHASEVGPRNLLHGLYLIWKATGEPGDLGRCLEVLAEIEESLSDEDRRTLTEGVPMIREILDA